MSHTGRTTSISEEARDLALLLHHHKSSKLQPASAHKHSTDERDAQNKITLKFDDLKTKINFRPVLSFALFSKVRKYEIKV